MPRPVTDKCCWCGQPAPSAPGSPTNGKGVWHLSCWMSMLRIRGLLEARNG